MHAENSVIYYRCKRQKVENFCAVTPHVDRSIFSEALIVETINLRNLPALMISPNQCDLISIPYFQSKQQQKCLDRMEPTVYKIPHEYVIGLGAVSSHLEELHQVIKLPVYVSTNLQDKYWLEN